MIDNIGESKKMEYKILCFHGFDQTAETMKKRMKNVVENFSGITFNFTNSVDEKMWYPYVNDIMTEKSMDMLKKNMENIYSSGEKYDGIIGFSQGAIFARIYISLYNPEISFLISVCGQDEIYDKFNICNLTFPEKIRFYNLYGNRDKYVLPESTKYLTKHLKNVEEIEFDGGHVIPNNEVIKIIDKIYR